MNVLIIHNGTKHIQALRGSFDRENIKVIRYNAITKIDSDWADLIVLSGGSIAVIGHKWLYRRQIDFIQKTDKPILGICLGAELIAYAYGVKPRRLLRRSHGIRIIDSASEELLSKRRSYRVWEAHRWYIPRVPDNFLELAHSASGVEVMINIQKKIAAMQFHPEVALSNNDGPELLKMVIAALK